MRNQTAKQIFLEYKQETQRAVAKYNFYAGKFPGVLMPAQAALVWRMGVLAEGWGAVAGRIEGVDYLGKWRTGE